MYRMRMTIRLFLYWGKYCRWCNHLNVQVLSEVEDKFWYYYVKLCYHVIIISINHYIK